MKPRFSSDYRTLLWAFLLFPTVMVVPYTSPRLLAWILPLALYVGFCAGVFAHNHNHCPTFRSRSANDVFATWVSVFYGHPVFAWIPTHNRNHHKYLNREGDATITWRLSHRNTWLESSASGSRMVRSSRSPYSFTGGALVPSSTWGPLAHRLRAASGG
jgi:beta-carotene hydroxylase